MDEAIEVLLDTLEPEDEETPRYAYALGADYVRSGDLDNGLLYLERARQLAEKYGQSDLLPAHDRDLERLRQAVGR